MTPKERAIKILKQDLGQARDNLYRAQAAFRGMTDEQLDSKYGQSDDTCREILDGYKNWEKETLEAIKAVENS